MTLPKSPSSINDLVDLLKGTSTPLLLLDTCSILDIPRNLHREPIAPTLIPSALRCVWANTSQPIALRFVIAKQVNDEYTRNLPQPVANLRMHIELLLGAANVLLPKEVYPRLEQDLESLENHVLNLTGQLLDECLIIAPEAASSSRAALRLSRGIAPAKRGSSNIGDCLIIEHYLELATRLRSQGFDKPCIFISSNHRDFGRAPNLKSPLNAEFAAISLDYSNDFSEVTGQLGI